MKIETKIILSKEEKELLSKQCIKEFCSCVAETKQLEGYDSVHYVRVNGWWCVAPKQLKQGDKAI